MQINAILRPVTINDSAIVLEWRNKEFVRKWMYTDDIIKQETHDKWFASMLNDKTGRSYLIYEIEGKPSGVVGFTNINALHQTADWAFYLGFDDLPKGSGSQMEKLAIEYGFKTLNLRKLNCEVIATNEKVLAMHKKHGFIEEGVFREQILKDGSPIDVVRFGLLAKDYFNSALEAK